MHLCVMDIFTLCDKISLQSLVRDKVLAFSEKFDFSTADRQLKDFRYYDRMSDALSELQILLGDDPENTGVLACMLKASADAYMYYQAKGIRDDIYFATMKCYTRFINETFRMTGKLYFDRFWWTVRQAGCHLFRIGGLEYELKHIGSDIVIGIHIPSDADFSPAAVDRSLTDAKAFMDRFFPDLSGSEYRCHSWLLDSQLKGMLRENSNILNFQSRFYIFDEGEAGTDFLEWVFNTRSTDYNTLPEKTSLQRKLKKHILSGGIIRNAYGILRKR